MAVLIVSTFDDEEAKLINNMLEGLDFPVDIEIKYEDDLDKLRDA